MTDVMVELPAAPHPASRAALPVSVPAPRVAEILSGRCVAEVARDEVRRQVERRTTRTYLTLQAAAVAILAYDVALIAQL